MALSGLLFLQRYGELEDALDDYVEQHKLDDKGAIAKSPKSTNVSTALMPIKKIETDSGVSMASSYSDNASASSQKKCLSITDIQTGIERLLEDIGVTLEQETCLQRSTATRLLAQYWEVRSSLKAIDSYEAIGNMWLYYAKRVELTEAGLLGGIASFSFVFKKLEAHTCFSKEALARFVFDKVLTFTDGFIDSLKKSSRLYQSMETLISEVLYTINQQGGFEGALPEGLGSIRDRNRKVESYREMHGHSAACPCHCNEKKRLNISPVGIFGVKVSLEERRKNSNYINKLPPISR